MLDAPVVDDALAPLLLGAAHAPRAPGVFAIAAPRGLSRLRAGSSRKTAHRCNRSLVQGFRCRIKTLASKTAFALENSWELFTHPCFAISRPSAGESADFIGSPLPREERKQRL